MSNIVVLNAAIPIVSLQFSFNVPELIPYAIRRLDPETSERAQGRTRRPPSGTMILEQRCDVSVAQLPSCIRATGYDLVDAFCQERADQVHKERKFFVARFKFSNKCYNVTEKFSRDKEAVELGLAAMCEASLWSVRIFQNPHYYEGYAMPHQFSISINMVARKLLYDADGNPLKQWVGDTSVLIQPREILQATDGAMSLVAVPQ